MIVNMAESNRTILLRNGCKCCVPQAVVVPRLRYFRGGLCAEAWCTHEADGMTCDVCGSGLTGACNQIGTHASPAIYLDTLAGVHCRKLNSDTEAQGVGYAMALSLAGSVSVSLAKQASTASVVRGSKTVGFLMEDLAGMLTNRPERRRMAQHGQFFFGVKLQVSHVLQYL